jgi:hypothetical protein
MPDIKTALEKALAQTAHAWAADDEAHQKIQPQQEKPMTVTVSATDTPSTPEKKDGRITNNISRITFEFIRDNPGLTIQQMTALLVAQGYKENTVSSLAYQMLRVRLIVADANGRLTAVVSEYVPIQTSMLRRRKPKAKAKPIKDVAPAPTPRKQVTLVNTRTGEVINPRPAAGIAALPTTHVAPTTEWSVESVIGGLNVRQAMAVYDELRQIFGA